MIHPYSDMMHCYHMCDQKNIHRYLQWSLQWTERHKRNWPCYVLRKRMGIHECIRIWQKAVKICPLLNWDNQTFKPFTWPWCLSSHASEPGPYTRLLIHKHLKSVNVAFVWSLPMQVRLSPLYPLAHYVFEHDALHMYLNILHFGDSYDRCFRIRPGLIT